MFRTVLIVLCFVCHGTLCVSDVFLTFICRISGGMALDRDIHASVSEQIKKNFYKAKWKVMYRKVRFSKMGKLQAQEKI